MAKLFVSYSRKDSTTAHKLIEAFRSIQQDVWVDWESIPPAADWLEQIFHGIEESDAFIFLISPDSIASEVCKVEINRAAQNNKRIIPIVLRDVDPKITPDNIRKLNWTFMRETDNFDEDSQRSKLLSNWTWIGSKSTVACKYVRWNGIAKKIPACFCAAEICGTRVICLRRQPQKTQFRLTCKKPLSSIVCEVKETGRLRGFRPPSL